MEERFSPLQSGAPTNHIILETSNTVDVLQLRALLYELHDHGSDILVRFRTLGSLWQPAFLRIIKVTDTGVVLAELTNDKPVILSNLDFVVQFEIDTAFKQFRPNNHYDVRTNSL